MAVAQWVVLSTVILWRLVKLIARYPRTMANLRVAIQELPLVLIFDNDDLRTPFRQVAHFQSGHRVNVHESAPAWLNIILNALP